MCSTHLNTICMYVCICKRSSNQNSLHISYFDNVVVVVTALLLLQRSLHQNDLIAIINLMLYLSNKKFARLLACSPVCLFVCLLACLLPEYAWATCMGSKCGPVPHSDTLRYF